MFGGGDKDFAEPDTFVADEQRAWTGEGRFGDRNAGSCDRGNGGDAMTVKEIERFWLGRMQGGNAKGRAGGGAESFGVPGVGRTGQEKNASRTEGLGRAQECADVTGVLQTGEDENQRVRAREQSFHGEGWWVNERGDALGLLGGDGAGEDIGRQEEMFGVIGQCEGGVVAIPEKYGGEAEMAARGFGDEVLAFNGDEASGRSPGAREGGAQLLDARVLAAGDET